MWPGWQISSQKTLFDDISAAAGRLDRYRQKGNVMRILLIEDDKNLCETLKYQLEREGILVDACTDGLDGLHYMKDNYIHFLRRRLKAVQSEVSLTTVRGVGYVLE